MPESGVTVVLATFNGARFLRAQLDSLAAQTWRPHLLIISDDGSTDDSLAIAERFAETAPFPVQIRRNSSNLGYGENFLAAAEGTDSEFLAFCDQDDVWYPRKLEFAVKALEASGAHLYVHGADLMDSRGVVAGRFRQGPRRAKRFPPLTLRPWGVFYGFSMVMRSRLLQVLPKEARGAHTFEHSTALSHDLWVYFIAMSLFTTYVDVRSLAAYRQHGAASTPSLVGNRFRRFTASLGKAVDPKLPREQIAAHRASVLRNLASASDDIELIPRVGRAADYWQKISRLEVGRNRLYRGPKVARFAAWSQLLVTGAYRRAGWRLCLKDLLAGCANLRR